MEANILLFKCVKAKQIYGVRVQKMSDGDWWRTWTFKIDPKNAQAEGYDKTPVQGNLYSTDEYPGCPHCGAEGFVQCGKCQKISCWNGEEKMTCPWCGNYMDEIVSATDKFNVEGGQF